MTDWFTELVELAGEFGRGRPGVHFLVESAEEGAGYASTPLERRLTGLWGRLRERLTSDPGFLTGDVLARLIRAMADLTRGTGQIRARLLAGGGDHATQDSVAREFVVEGIEGIRTALGTLSERGIFPLDEVAGEVLLTPIQIGALHGSDSLPFIERCFEARLALFRRPRIFPLVKRLLDKADRQAAREAAQNRRLANYRRTVIDDGRDGLLPEPPSSPPKSGTRE